MSDGQGYVERLPSGRYRARLPRALGRRKSETFDSEAQAQGWLAAMLEALRAPAPEPARTLRGFGAVVLSRRKDAGLATSRDDASRFAHVLLSPLADLPLPELRPPHIAAFARELATRPATRPAPGGRAPTQARLSRQSQVHVLNLLRTILKEAVTDGLIEANPAREVRVQPAPEGEDLERWTWLAQEEIDQLLGCEEVPKEARLLYQVAIYTGLRQGELWALRWELVRLCGPKPQLTVARSGKRRTTKSGKVRAVPLLPPAQEALEALRELAGAPDKGLVFPGRGGRQRAAGDDGGWADQKRGAGRLQVGHRAAAGLRPGIRFHDLRHTCASHLLQGTWGRRWRMEEVKAMLGHSSIVVTQRYAHLGDSALADAAAATPGSGPRAGPRAGAQEGSPSTETG